LVGAASVGHDRVRGMPAWGRRHPSALAHRSLAGGIIGTPAALTLALLMTRTPASSDRRSRLLACCAVLATLSAGVVLGALDHAAAADEQQALPIQITSLTPDQATAGSGALRLRVSGINLVSGMRVCWNNARLDSSLLSATLME